MDGEKNSRYISAALSGIPDDLAAVWGRSGQALGSSADPAITIYLTHLHHSCIFKRTIVGFNTDYSDNTGCIQIEFWYSFHYIRFDTKQDEKILLKEPGRKDCLLNE
jgi:hypothetical protein